MNVNNLRNAILAYYICYAIVSPDITEMYTDIPLNTFTTFAGCV